MRVGARARQARDAGMSKLTLDDITDLRAYERGARSSGARSSR